MFTKAFALLGLASAASAHIVMTNPVPFGNPDNSPLFADGSNFPCKGPVSFGGENSNIYEQGSTQQLSFRGTAVHGGGSCQVSVTTDLNPTRDSVWKVIKSIEGGCPARGVTGNLGTDASLDVPFKYDFTIPSDLAAGDYIVAWTWFNKVGNREMYMNCAPMTVTGSGGNDGFMSTLPDMFLANLGAVSNGCSTDPDADLEFPNPGNDVDRLNGATTTFAPVTTKDGCLVGAPGTAAPGTAPTSAPKAPDVSISVEVPVPEAPTSTEASVSTPTKSTGPPGGVFMTVTTSAPVEAAPTMAAPTSAPEAPKVPQTPSGGATPGSPCSVEGEWLCIGGSSFQRCASGTWSPIQPVAQGTTCQVGQSSEIKIFAGAKRAMGRFLRARL